jgi:hypothetical protein
MGREIEPVFPYSREPNVLRHTERRMVVRRSVAKEIVGLLVPLAFKIFETPSRYETSQS